MILSKLRVTTSHVTLNNTLNTVKIDVDKKLLDLKLGVQKESRRICSSESRSVHEYTRNTDSCSVIEMDHDYSK